MSLILDALKKSEAERLRGQVPNLLSPSPATTTQYRSQKRSVLPWIILATAFLAILVLGYFFLKSNNRETPDASNATATVILQPAKPSAQIVNPAGSAPAAAPAIATVIPAQAPAPATPAKEISPSKPLSLFDPQAGAEPIKPAVESVQTQANTRIAGMAEMPVDLRQQLPALKLSMHVFSSESAKRFAIIDGQRVNEGSLIGAAVVEEIRQDGVLLSMQGQSYLLPRP